MHVSALEKTKMAKYQLKQVLIFIFFICYAVVGFVGYRYAPKGEYFPIFSWSLFSAVRTPWEGIELEIIRIGDTEFAEPVNYFDLDGYFAASDTRSTAVLKASVRLLNLYSEDEVAAVSMRRKFESSYLGGQGPVVYRFVYLWYDPLTRVRSGEVIERRVLAQFSTEQAE